MSKNYYDILEITRSANNEQIAHAYPQYIKITYLDYRFRRLSLKFHPLKNPTDLATNSLKFSDVCESYDVLSNGNDFLKFTYIQLREKLGLTNLESMV
jgi:DnaJ-class molecular chaperone